MTLDLKAKAKQIVSQWDDGIEDFSGEIQDVYKALKEVQDATRRETIQECLEIAMSEEIPELGEMPPAFMTFSKGQIVVALVQATAKNIEKRIYALLTTPEKK